MGYRDTGLLDIFATDGSDLFGLDWSGWSGASMERQFTFISFKLSAFLKPINID